MYIRMIQYIHKYITRFNKYIMRMEYNCTSLRILISTTILGTQNRCSLGYALVLSSSSATLIYYIQYNSILLTIWTLHIKLYLYMYACMLISSSSML